MFSNKCPLCGTRGKVWNAKPEVFMCPACMSFYSVYGLVMEAQNEQPEVWH